MQINTACKDYDSINRHSHQSTRTTGAQGGRGANNDHAQGGGEGEERRWSIYIREAARALLSKQCCIDVRSGWSLYEPVLVSVFLS